MSFAGQRLGSRTAIAVGAGLATAAVIVVANSLGLVRGPLALVVIVATVVTVPTATHLSRRIALNVALGLGLIPLLWWVALPLPVSVGHVAIVTAALLGFVVFRFCLSRAGRVVIVPVFRRPDWVIVGSAMTLAWLYWPFIKYRSGPGSVSMLMGGYGGDNVAHFDIFEMIRKTGVTGPGWPTPADGSIWAYVPYPQHFHVLAVFAGEAWVGPGVGSVGTEVGAFGVGTAIIISLAVIALIAAIVSLQVFAGQLGYSFIAGVSVLGFVVLGLGSQSFNFGFPGFLLAVVATLLAIVLSLEKHSRAIVQLLAVSCLLIVVAHSWSLFAPLAAVAWGVVVIRLPWARPLRRLWASLTQVLIIIVGTIAAAVFALWLVLDATHAAGSPDQALGTPGAVPVSPVTTMLACALALIALAWIAILPVRFSRTEMQQPRPWRWAALIAATAVIGLGEGGALIAAQFSLIQSLGYFQYKYFNGLFLVVAVLLCITILREIIVREQRASADRLDVGAAAPTLVWRSRLASVVSFVLVAVAILAFASVPPNPHSSLDDVKPQGLTLRDSLAVEANSVTPRVLGIMAAAAIMTHAPCINTIYLDPISSAGMADSNQWALALSATWTEQASAINSFVYTQQDGVVYGDKALRTGAQLGPIVAALLDSQPHRCVIVSPEDLSTLPPAVAGIFAGQILSW